MRISQRGRITIPKPLRDRFGLDHDAEVEITPTDEGVLIHACTPEDAADNSHSEPEEALLFGWLREVNWARGTAQLHGYGGGYVPLRFEPALGDDMRRLATEYVEVRGRGRFNEHDRWTTVEVEKVIGTRSWREPFDIDALLNDPNPKIFDPDKVVTIDLSDEEFEDFLRAIPEGRDAGYR
ncbi:MAG: AbrB/MazE/SpoVT family DNA-binding domain-containing protein [Chloroflexi bacterium]|nr:AbrB/MazE/SpoVT family DNA-binding domain-containing protein [Chloroflexota bacterium]